MIDWSATTPSIEADPQDWLDNFAAAAERGRRLAEGLDAVAFNAAPEAGRWSVGQCLAHLTLTGNGLLPGLDRAVNRLRQRDERGAAPYPTGRLGHWFALSLRPGHGPKLSSPARTVPPDTAGDPDEVVAAFAASMERFRQLAEIGSGLALSSVKIASPMTRLVRLNAAAWFEVTRVHTARHLVQAADVRRALGFPDPDA